MSVPKIKSLKRKLFLKQNGLCAECGGKMIMTGHHTNLQNEASIEHKIPRSVGGPHDIWNLELVHIQCNQQRNSRFQKRHPWLGGILQDTQRGTPWKRPDAALGGPGNA